MSEDRFVFGISVDPLRDREYGFVRADAILKDRCLRTDFDPQEEFPTEGNIWVAEDHLPKTGLGAIWRVRRGMPRSGSRYAEWSAISRLASGPLEVIWLPVSSARVGGVRQQLIEGVDLGYVPASQVLVQLEDGIVVGPVKGSGYDQEGFSGFRCTSDAFAEPLRAWDKTRLDTFYVEAPYTLDRRRRRTFVCDLDLPDAQRWIDFAEFSDTAKSVLKPLASADGRMLSAAQLRQLTLALRSEDYPESLRERVSRVRRAVQSLSTTREELDGLMPAVLANPQVVREITAARHVAEEQERKRIEEEKHGTIEEIRRLREQEQQLRDHVARLSHEADIAQATVREAADAAASEVRARVREAVSDAGKLLAEVAILRPFLGTAAGSDTAGRPDRADTPAILVRPYRVTEDSSEAEESEPATAADMAARLTLDLKTGGVAPNAARLLAREMLAALLAGQVPVLTGSFANRIAEIASRALAGRSVMIAEVPLGLVSDGPLRDLVDSVRGAAEGVQHVMVLRGVDRSAVEVYGGVLRETVAKRVLASDFEDVPLAFVATASGGPACLPIGPGTFDLGPVIDTDLLSYSRKGGSQTPLRRPISIEKWSAWRGELTSGSKETLSSTRMACNELSVATSMLWRRGTESATSFLAALGGEAESEITQSILARWIVPRAQAEGLSPDEIASRLEALGVDDRLIQDEEGAHAPVAALLERARRMLKAGV